MSTYRPASLMYWHADAYPGAKIDPNCGVIHTTEGSSVPTYRGGATAPNYTALPDFSARRLVWFVHFPDEMSARALENDPGGVETNTANAVQVELVGTCNDDHAKSWPGVGTAGEDYIYWPDAPEWALAELGAFLADMHQRHGIKLDGPTDWLHYGRDDRRPGVTPASYGESPARMNYEQWREFYGWCGHQHVPENAHGDPGGLPFARVLAYATGDQAPPAKPPRPAPKKKHRPIPPKETLTMKLVNLRSAQRTLVRGPGVKPLQRLLDVPDDGLGGPKTRDALGDAQSAAGLTRDYVFGPKTAGALLAGKGGIR